MRLRMNIVQLITMTNDVCCIYVLGWLGLYSDVSKVGNMNLPGRQIDKHDEISG